MTSIVSNPPGRAPLPTHLDLPDSDGRIVENFQELPLSLLLTDSIMSVLRRLHPDGRFAVGHDSGIYWKITDPPLNGVVAPDWYYVPNVSPELVDGQRRRSYVLWQELQSPTIVIEFVSGDGTEEHDRTPGTGKFWIYENRICAEYYAIFDAECSSLAVFRLQARRYEPVPPNARGHYPIEPIGVTLGLWRARFMGMNLPWIRWYDNQGNMLLIGDERADVADQRANAEAQRAEAEAQRAEAEAQRADTEAQRADAEAQRAQKLAERLRALGIDPEA